MSIMEEFEIFSSREGFNKSLRHFKLVNEVVSDFESGYNLADIVNNRLTEGSLENNQIAPIVRALLIDKYGYVFKSQNLSETYSQEQLAAQVASWVAADIVIAYFHPEYGIQLLNPKNKDDVNKIGEFKKYELITVYAGLGKNTKEKINVKANLDLLQLVIQKCFEVIKGKKIKPPPTFLKGEFKLKTLSLKASAPAKEKTARHKTKSASIKTSASPEKTKEKTLDIDATKFDTKPSTPAAVSQTAAPVQVVGRMNKIGPFGVVVSNELFHNGNVEAWKRIIHSYTNKYPNYQVYVYYDGEVIHDLNSLFKWGKVKHGTAILVAIAGPDQQIKDVSKLRKYLTEGASPRFEQFLRGLPGKDLGLF